jgi:hypothetical protein
MYRIPRAKVAFKDSRKPVDARPPLAARVIAERGQNEPVDSWSHCGALGSAECIEFPLCTHIVRPHIAPQHTRQVAAIIEASSVCVTADIEVASTFFFSTSHANGNTSAAHLHHPPHAARSAQNQHQESRLDGCVSRDTKWKSNERLDR